jgi:hypothetical protein
MDTACRGLVLSKDVLCHVILTLVKDHTNPFNMRPQVGVIRGFKPKPAELVSPGLSYASHGSMTVTLAAS